MLQPFERFKASYIEALKDVKKKYIVTQVYTRGSSHLNDKLPIDILFSVYDDPGLAQVHFNAVKELIFAYILDLNNEKHTSTITAMLQPDSRYAIYWSVVRDKKKIKKKLDLTYKDHIRRYITTNTSWRISADDKIHPTLQVVFGELYILLKRGTQSIRVKFETIEKS